MTATTATTVRTSRSITRRPSVRLAAAVLSASALAGVAALPAQAAPRFGGFGSTVETQTHGTPPTGYINADDAAATTSAVFSTAWDFDPEDARVAVAASADGVTLGEETDVPFTAIPEIDGGRFDVLESRRLLGDAGEQTVVYKLHVQDEDQGDIHVASLIVEPDADLTTTRDPRP